MDQAAALLTEGVLWLYLAGWSLGAGGGQVLSRHRKGRSWVSVAALLLSCALTSLSLGLILAPQFLRQFSLLRFLLGLFIGALCGSFPRITVPVLLLVLASGGILVNRSISSMPGYPLQQGPVEILVLRAESEGRRSIELRYQGYSEIRNLTEAALRLDILSLEIPVAIPWPEHRYLYLMGLIGESGLNGLVEKRDALTAVLEKIGLLSLDEFPGPVLAIEPYMDYRVQAQDGEIVVSPLSFRMQTSDTGDE